MMLRPRWPSAGPMGGDGFALPAGTCSLMSPTIFFAIQLSCGSKRTRQAFSPSFPYLLRLLDLPEFQLHRRRAAENRDRHAQPALLVVHVLDGSLEVRERTILHAHHLADFEQHLRLGLLHAFTHLLHDGFDFLLR